ncbi:MAG: class I SAM-dependent methyltransferase [Bacteroidales bacterium]
MSRRHYRDYDEHGAPDEFDKNVFGTEIGEYLRETQEKIVISMIENNLSVLDVGAGSGRLTIPLARKVSNVVAFDAAKEMLKKARDKAEGNSNISYTIGDAHKLPYKEESFDHVISFRMLMHVEDWRKVISEMCRVSKRYVILEVPPKLGFALLSVFLIKIIKPLGVEREPIRVFSVKELRKELKKNNFEIVLVNKQFFLPYVIHRGANSVRFTRITELILSKIGLTRVFGAPITIKAERI